MASAASKFTALIEQARRAGAARRAAHHQRVLEGRSLYASDGGEPTLLTSFALYVDELGAKKRLATMNDEDLRADIERQDALGWFLHDPDGGSDDTQRALTFSDNIVVASPLRPHPEHSDHGLFFLVFSAACYQLNMVIRGRPLRGGIAAGPLYADHSFVTGAALVDAVHLEDTVATTPRILLDETCTNLALAEEARYPEDGVYNHFLLRDEDGHVFVNYLVAAAEDGELSPGDLDAALSQHCDVIEAGLSRWAGTSVEAKYVWMAAYHDHVASNFYGRTDLIGRTSRSFATLQRS